MDREALVKKMADAFEANEYGKRMIGATQLCNDKIEWTGNELRAALSDCLSVIEAAGGYAPEGSLIIPSKRYVTNEMLDAGARGLAEYETWLQPEKNIPAAFACFEAMINAMRSAHTNRKG